MPSTPILDGVRGYLKAPFVTRYCNVPMGGRGGPKLMPVNFYYSYAYAGPPRSVGRQIRASPTTQPGVHSARHQQAAMICSWGRGGALMGSISVAWYKPKPGCEDALRELVRNHLPPLRAEGLVT